MQNMQEIVSSLLDSPDFPVIVFLLILTVIGTIGNLHVLVAYSCVFKPVSNFNIFVTIVAFFDVIGSLCVIPMEIYVLYYHNPTDNDSSCRTYSLLKSYFILGSGFMPFIITFERYLKICRFDADQVISRTTVAVCITMSIISIVVPFPSPNIDWNPNKHRLEWLQCDLQNRFKQDLFPIIYYFLVALCYITFVSSQIFMFFCIKKKLKSNALEQLEQQESFDEQTEQNLNLDNKEKCLALFEPEPCSSKTKKPEPKGDNSEDDSVFGIEENDLCFTKEPNVKSSAKGTIVDNLSNAKIYGDKGIFENISKSTPETTSERETMLDKDSKLCMDSNISKNTLNTTMPKMDVVIKDNSQVNLNSSITNTQMDTMDVNGVKTGNDADKREPRTRDEYREMLPNVGKNELGLSLNHDLKTTSKAYLKIDKQEPIELGLLRSKIDKSEPVSIVESCLIKNRNNQMFTEEKPNVGSSETRNMNGYEEQSAVVDINSLMSVVDNTDNTENEIKPNKEKPNPIAVDNELNSSDKEKHDGNAEIASCDKDTCDGNVEQTSCDQEKRNENLQLTSGDIRDKVLMFCSLPRKQRVENQGLEKKEPNLDVSATDSQIMTFKSKLQPKPTFNSSIEARIGEGTSVVIVDCQDDEMVEYDWRIQSKREKQIKWDGKTKASFIQFLGFSITFFLHIIILPVLILNDSFGQALERTETWPVIKILTRLYYLHLIMNPFIYAIYDRQFRYLYCRSCLRN